MSDLKIALWIIGMAVGTLIGVGAMGLMVIAFVLNIIDEEVKDYE